MVRPQAYCGPPTRYARPPATRPLACAGAQPRLAEASPPKWGPNSPLVRRPWRTCGVDPKALGLGVVVVAPNPAQPARVQRYACMRSCSQAPSIFDGASPTSLSRAARAAARTYHVATLLS
jgi:hypothetical protein